MKDNSEELWLARILASRPAEDLGYAPDPSVPLTSRKTGASSVPYSAGALLRAFQKMDALVEERGLRKGSERYYLVAAIFFAFPGTQSVDELFELVQIANPNLQKSTVYKTLKLLEASGLAIEEWHPRDPQVRFSHVELK
jgi:hypothetical protein